MAHLKGDADEAGEKMVNKARSEEGGRGNRNMAARSSPC